MALRASRYAVCSILKIYLHLLCLFWNIENILNATCSTGLNASCHLLVDLTTAIHKNEFFLVGSLYTSETKISLPPLVINVFQKN